MDRRFGERLTVALASDERYAMQLGTLLRSLSVNASQATINVYIVDGGMSARSLRKLRRLAQACANLEAEWVDASRADLRGLPVFGHVRETAYLRILLADLLPARVSRLLYLDSDIVVTNSLDDLWRSPFDGWPLQAIQEQDCVLRDFGIESYAGVGCEYSDMPYLNSGVLLMDLESWRKEQLGAAILRTVRENAARIRFWDQDGINAVMRGQWKKLSARWNRRVDCGTTDWNSTGDGPAAYVRRLLASSSILHFASSAKPWNYHVDHPACGIFFAYLDATPWRGWRPRPPLRALRNRHFWGKQLRRVPGVGEIWSYLRAGGKAK